MTTQIGIVGAGAWGTALAVAASRAGCAATIWGRDTHVVEDINVNAHNERRLPGRELPEAVRATASLADLIEAHTLVLAIPAQQMRAVCASIAGAGLGKKSVVICAKGIERNTGAMMSAVVAETLPDATLGVLSGPSFAADVADGLPTAVTLAANDVDTARSMARALASKTLRLYLSDDVRGVEIGGAAKNVLAIACGIVSGKGLGASAGAALTTRGFAELTRLGAAMGARPETLGGLSGLGDLILTCSSYQSRNMSFGHALGSSMSVDEALHKAGAAVEGVHTAGALYELAERHKVDMPIAGAVARIVSGELGIDRAIDNLLSRPLRVESE